MAHEDKIATLNQFRDLVLRYDSDKYGNHDLRAQINRLKSRARSVVIEVGAHHTFVISPPPIVGGLIMRNVDAFEAIFNPPYDQNMIPAIVDMIDVALGEIEGGALDKIVQNQPIVREEIRKGYAFVAMSIGKDRKDLEDVLDAIKQAASQVDIQAERIDEQEANERITDRILESIRVAEFVIVDVTDARPNVFYEAGYAQGIGKIPIFLAKYGTALQFDIQDFPIIFYDNMRSLRENLVKRLRAVAGGKSE